MPFLCSAQHLHRLGIIQTQKKTALGAFFVLFLPITKALEESSLVPCKVRHTVYIVSQGELGGQCLAILEQSPISASW